MRYWQKERFHEEVEFHRRADRIRPEAGRNRNPGRRHRTEDGDQRADLLSVEKEILGPPAERAQAPEAAGR